MIIKEANWRAFSLLILGIGLLIILISLLNSEYETTLTLVLITVGFVLFCLGILLVFIPTVAVVERIAAAFKRSESRDDGGLNDIQKNEVSAQNILVQILTGQEMLRTSKYIDQNNNGMGEYGFLDELAGHVKCRCANNEQTGPIFTDDPFVPKELGLTDTIQGESEYDVVELSGYCFRVFLPSADGSNGTSRCTDLVHVPSAELVFIAYGWPMEAGVTGNRVFVLDPTGCPYEWANLGKTYSGKENGPAWDAALNLADSWLDRSIDEGGPGQTVVECSQWVPSA